MKNIRRSRNGRCSTRQHVWLSCRDIPLGTSAGGQRAKAIIAYNKETGEVRSGQVDAPEGFDYYLIKLDGVSAKAGFKETENYGRLEYSFYKLVKACGIKMTECSLIEENDRAHFLTKRFDRKRWGQAPRSNFSAGVRPRYQILVLGPGPEIKYLLETYCWGQAPK